MTAVASTRDELAGRRAEVVNEAGPGAVAVVMTMGALHAGHAELIRRARLRARVVIVTDFLNPLQFAPGEDLDKYPRTFESDLQLCRAGGVDLLFAPTPDVVYPFDDALVRVAAGPVGDVLEGESRPGHFDGVVTVVAKLLHLTAPNLAYFGQKDAQQLWLIDRMVRDLDFSVEVVSVPTVRDEDGLALSSRNIYLSAEDRSAARVLNRALEAGVHASPAGSRATISAAKALLNSERGIRVDYLELVDPLSFSSVGGDHRGDALLLVAAFVGPTRLIDNARVQLGPAMEEV